MPEDFGIVTLNGDVVTDIIEKPTEPVSHLANAGIYIFTPEIFDAIKKTPMSRRGEYEITDSLKYLIENGFSIPDDFAILSWDGLPESNYFIQSLSTMVIPHEKMLQNGLKWIDGKSFTKRKIILDIEIREGETFPTIC